MSVECGIIVPRQEYVIGYREDGYLASCILSGVHGYGPHVFRTPEGLLMAWEDDMECGCCEPEEDARCIVHWEIEESDILLYQNGGPRK